MGNVSGDPGVLGAHVTQERAKDSDQDLAIIQQPKMEVLPVQGHHQSMKIVSYVSFLYESLKSSFTHCSAKLHIIVM